VVLGLDQDGDRRGADDRGADDRGSYADGIDRRSGQDQLERIHRANLFVIALGGQEQWYRYHHIFRDFLLRHLAHSCTREQIEELHRRASRWLIEHGLIHDGLRHAISGGDFASAVATMAEHRHDLMNNEHWHQLGRWLSLFPRAIIDVHAELLLTEAWILRSNARVADIPEKLERAEKLVARMSLDPASSAASKAARLRGELDCLRAYSSSWVGDTRAVVLHAERGLKLTPHIWWSARLMARLMLAGAYQKSGDRTRAYAAMYDALAEQPSQEAHIQRRFLVSAGFVHLVFADLDGLMQVANRVLALSEQQDQAESTCWAHWLIGVTHYYRNELAAAERNFNAVIAHRYQANAQNAIQAMFSLALTLLAQGLPDKAREMADLAVTFTLEINHPLMLSAARVFQAELAVRQGRLADAERWLEQFPPEAITPTLFMTGRWLTSAKVLVERGKAQADRAARELSQMQAIAESNHDPRMLIEVLALQALHFGAQGRHEPARTALARAVSLAQPGHLLRIFVDLGPRMGSLLTQVSGRGIAPAFVEAVLAALAQVQSVVTPGAAMSQNGLIDPLTERELEVVTLLAQRLSDKEIAERLLISLGTVKRHTHSIYEKLHVGSRRDAVAKATTLGLIQQRYFRS
jgi:LuxR family maltose regulon positive regulatory protein